MDYEEKYNAALERAAKLRIQNPFDTVGQMVEHIFPELKENENEKIRKDILCYFEHYAHDINGIDVQKWINWLEKQDEQLTDKIEPKFKVGVWVILNGVVSKILDKQKYGFVGLDIDGKDFFCNYGHTDSMRLWTIQDAKDGDVLVDSYSKDSIIILYKGIYKERSILAHCGWNGYNFSVKTNGLGYGGLDNTDYLPATKEQCDLLFQKIREAGYEWDQKEKKLIKMKETKFKVRDWLQYRDAKPFLVEEITKQGYCNGNSCLPFEWEDEIHLWTIEDAKRGDVLVDVYGNIGIFDKCYDFDWMSCCSLGNNGGFQYFTVEHENEKTYPATKEQCDLLFQKMKEEGWKWDNEKKELNKIEQNVVDNVESKFHPGDWVIDNCGNTYQIESATEIESEHIFGYTIVGGGYFNDNNDVRLWSIDDAKCGDVLVDKYNNIGIYKEIGAIYWDSYIYLGCDGVIRGFSIGGRHEQTGTHPATKEQCDLFFAKMKEAGWERIVKIKN